MAIRATASAHNPYDRFSPSRGGNRDRTFIAGIFERKADGNVTKYYDFGGRRIAMSTSNPGGAPTVRYFADDHLSGTSMIFDSGGGFVSRTRYQPYGNPWTQHFDGGMTALPTDKLFTGYRREGVQSGMYYAGARFYSADLGRFLSADPLQQPGANPYTYALNNPLTYTDPTGMCVPDITCNGLWQQNGIDPRPRFVPIRPPVPALTLEQVMPGPQKWVFAGIAAIETCRLYCGDTFDALGIDCCTLFSGDDDALEDELIEGAIEGFFDDPEAMLKHLRDQGYSAQEAFEAVEQMLERDPNHEWVRGPLSRGDSTGRGGKLIDIGDRLVQWSPGSVRHHPEFQGRPYIKVTAGGGPGTAREVRVPFPK